MEDGLKILDEVWEAMHKDDMLAAHSLCLAVVDWIKYGGGDKHCPEHIERLAQVFLDASKLKDLQSELERVKAERDLVQKSCNRWRGTAYRKNRALKDLKSIAMDKLEKIICTEGEDAGIFLVSPESPTNYDPELNCHVYEHEHFSELGDALIELWEVIACHSSSESCRAAMVQKGTNDAD